jgi:riboflavin transporter FmnP
MKNERLYRMILTALLGSMAFLLMYFGEVRLPFFAEFLKYDPGDVPAVVATYTLGPGVGLGVQGLKAALFWVSGKSTAGWVGVLANFAAGGALVLGAGLAHRLLERSGLKAWYWAILSGAIGTLVMTALLIPINAVLVYPLFGMKGAAAWNAAVAISTPFNLVKGALSCGLSLAFYRRLERILPAALTHKEA